jgi:hypothetical protein
VRRYTRDPRLRAFQAQIRAEVDRIGSLAAGQGYVVYVIHDPSLKDNRGRFTHGPPVYVGESKQLRVRANDHMRDGGGGSTDTGIKTGRLKQIIGKWVVPRFEIVDSAPTHLTALIAETVWARRYVWLGYDLANGWPEHRTRERPHGLASVPLGRVWDFTVAEALEDEVGLSLRCEKCGVSAPVPLDTIEPQTKLSALKSLKLTCKSCDAPLLRIDLPDPTSWRWASYQTRSMDKHQ